MPAAPQLQAIRAEGVGGDNMAARLIILRVNLPNRLRISQVHQFRQRTGLQALLLQKRAHAAIKKEQLLPEQRTNIQWNPPFPL